MSSFLVDAFVFFSSVLLAGDFAYKTGGDIEAHEQQVSVEPEFVEVERSADDQFLILACDGIWDVMTNEDVASYVLDKVQGGMTDMAEVSKALIMECLHRGSRDNMSAIIVRLPGAPQPSRAAVELMEQKKKEEEEREAAQARREAAQQEAAQGAGGGRMAEEEEEDDGAYFAPPAGAGGSGRGQTAAEDDEDPPAEHGSAS